ncbi:MAG: hypothetical protein ACI85O_002025 [Saprospiraceae bacterium]|jgi:hypothetical protein
MKRNRVFILDEMIESCRLMPTWVQFILFIGAAGIVSFTIPMLFYISVTIILVQVVFIILLIKKYIVYRRISKLEVAIKKRVIWIFSKRDKDEKYKKGLINLGLIILTLILFFTLQNTKLLIINGLFCVLFFLKIAFYVPLISVRIIEDDKFVVINKGLGERMEINLYEINSIKIVEDKIIVNRKKIEIPLDFQSEKEVRRLMMFLKGIDKFRVD